MTREIYENPQLVFFQSKNGDVEAWCGLDKNGYPILKRLESGVDEKGHPVNQEECNEAIIVCEQGQRGAIKTYEKATGKKAYGLSFF